MRVMHRILVVTLLAHVGACSNDMLGIDVCGKLCDIDDDCGPGLTCSAGKCGGGSCGELPGGTDAGVISGVSSSSGVVVGSSSAGASSSISRASSSASITASSSTVTLSSSFIDSSSAAQMASSTASSSMASSTASSVGVVSSSRAPSSSATSVMTVNSAGMSAGVVCGAGAVCDGSGMCINACFIDGMVRMPGLNPMNVCERCVPLSSTSTWSPEPDTATCDDMDLCTNPDHCDGAGACGGTARCPATTPMCTPSPFSCACTTSPADSCASGANNKRCMGSACGCMDNSDCGAGFSCGANNRCTPCNTVTSCGLSCGSCRSLPMTIDEGSYYQCSGNMQALDIACLVTACSTTRANCNSDDVDACEITLTGSDANCAFCGAMCASGRNCSNSQCACGGDGDCPMGQRCNGGRCRCQSNANCGTGYQCVSNRCTRM